MTRRCRATLTFIASTALLGPAASVRAGSMASYELRSTAPPGTAPIGPDVAIVPPSPDRSPPTLLPGSTGFNAPGLVDDLGRGTLADGAPLQVLRPRFDARGFAPGGRLDFGPNMGQDQTGPPPTLRLAPGTSGLTLLPEPNPVTATPPDVPGTAAIGSVGMIASAQVPEPISLALWSVAAGFGLLRARAFRRARQVAL